jgi:hypothetical protein
VKRLKPIDEAPAGGITHLTRKITGAQSTDWRVYERELGTTPEQVRDQEERVHQRAGDLAQHSCDSYATTDPQLDGDTVSLHSHDSEDSDQDAIHRQAARLALGRVRK